MSVSISEYKKENENIRKSLESLVKISRQIQNILRPDSTIKKSDDNQNPVPRDLQFLRSFLISSYEDVKNFGSFKKLNCKMK